MIETSPIPKRNIRIERVSTEAVQKLNLRSLFTPGEFDALYDSRGQLKLESAAGRLAAKFATQRLSQPHFSLLDLEIMKHDAGDPYINFPNKDRTYGDFLVSISHDKGAGSAIAVVIKDNGTLRNLRIGVDVSRCERVVKSAENARRLGGNRVFTQEEVDEAGDNMDSYAKRYVVKEAVAKVLVGKGPNGVHHLHTAVTQEADGAIRISNLTGIAKELSEKLDVNTWSAHAVELKNGVVVGLVIAHKS